MTSIENVCGKNPLKMENKHRLASGKKGEKRPHSPMKNQFFFKTLIFWCCFLHRCFAAVLFFTPLFRCCSFFFYITVSLLFFTPGVAIPPGIETKDSRGVNPFRKSIRITQKRRSYQNLLEAAKT